jgi:hypothetical protein
LGILLLGTLLAFGIYAYEREVINSSLPIVVGIGTSTFAGLAEVDQTQNRVRFEFPFAVGGAPAEAQEQATRGVKCGHVFWLNPANIEILEKRPPGEIADSIEWVAIAAKRACPGSDLVVSAGIPRRLGPDFVDYHQQVTEIVEKRYAGSRVCIADLTAPWWGLSGTDGQLKPSYSKGPDDLIHLNQLGNQILMGKADQFFWYLYQTGICPSQN